MLILRDVVSNLGHNITTDGNPIKRFLGQSNILIFVKYVVRLGGNKDKAQPENFNLVRHSKVLMNEDEITWISNIALLNNFNKPSSL